MRRISCGALGLALAMGCGEAKPVESPALPPKPVVTSPSPVVDAPLELHVVAVRRGPISLSVERGLEVALAGALPIALRTNEPLVVDAMHREGLPMLTESVTDPVVDIVRFGGHWPREATLVAHVGSVRGDESLVRAIRWNGSAWARDDAIVRGVEHYWIPLGPFEGDTTLVLPCIEHTLPDATPTHLARRRADGTTTSGPAMPPEEKSRFVSTQDGWVFAGFRAIAVWSPGRREWRTHELPDGTDADITGFVAVANDDVYAYGTRGLGVLDALGGYIAHWDGKTWEAKPAPKCHDGIARLAPGRTTSWAYCVNENYEPRSAPETRELWRTDANGEWQRVSLALDAATARVRVDVLGPNEEPPPMDAARPRAADVAITADGTLWLLVSDAATWTLARSSTAARVLVLPSDAELYAPAPK